MAGGESRPSFITRKESEGREWGTSSLTELRAGSGHRRARGLKHRFGSQKKLVPGSVGLLLNHTCK